MAAKKPKTLAQIALKKGGVYNDDFKTAFETWATRWNATCGNPVELAQALDVRTDDGLFSIIMQSFPEYWAAAKKKVGAATSAVRTRVTVYRDAIDKEIRGEEEKAETINGIAISLGVATVVILITVAVIMLKF